MNSKEWFVALVAAGHEPQLNGDDELDVWAYENDHHNGPCCVKCGKVWCKHCGDPIGPCDKGKEHLAFLKRQVEFYEKQIAIWEKKVNGAV